MNKEQEKKGFNFTKLDPIEEVVEKTETPEAQELISGKEKNNKVSKLVSSRKEAMQRYNLTPALEQVSTWLEPEDKADLELILIKRRDMDQKSLLNEFIVKSIRDELKKLGLKSLREE